MTHLATPISKRQQAIVAKLHQALKSCTTETTVKLDEYSPEEVKEVVPWIKVMFCCFRHNYSLHLSFDFTECVIERYTRKRLFYPEIALSIPAPEEGVA